MINVVNRHEHQPTMHDIPVHRGTPLGNPFPVDLWGRDGCIREYKRWLNEMLFLPEFARNDSLTNQVLAIKNELNRIYTEVQQHDVNLVCYCAPAPCHADYIREMIIGKLMVKASQPKAYYEMSIAAFEVYHLLAPHCERIEIAGSLRRQEDRIVDIDIVCVPKEDITEHVLRPGDLFSAPVIETTVSRSKAFCRAVEKMAKVKGEPDGKYTQRLFRSKEAGIVKVDVFMVEASVFGTQLAIRTGPAEFSRRMAATWKQKGLTSEGAVLKDAQGNEYRFAEERELFDFLGMPNLPAWERK